MRTYIVQGMHRSGTSFIAKSLFDQGIDMGKNLGEPNWANPHGYYENQDFIKLNTRILKSVGGEWDILPSKERIEMAGNDFKEEIRTLIDNSKGEMWGWKDPRTTVTLPIYLDILEEDEDNDVYLICMFRKPKKVAASNEKVGNRSAERAEEITKDYNERLFDNIKEFLEYE